MKNTIMSIRKAASLIREAGLTSEDVYEATKIAPELARKIIEIRSWMNGTLSIPHAEMVEAGTPITKPISSTPWLDCGFKGTDWRPAGTGHNVMVSELGEVYDLTTHTAVPTAVVNGHMNLIINGCYTRLESMVVATFAIRRPDGVRNACVIVHKDGNVRNCAASNLEKVEYDKAPIGFRNDRERDVLDISYQILAHNGVIDEIIKEYPEQRRTNTFKNFIISIRDKREHIDISDTVFWNIGNEIFPADPEAVVEEGDGVDTIGLLMMTKDVELVAELIKQKIDSAKPITTSETAVLVYRYVKRGFKSSSTIKEKIAGDYGLSIPPKQMGLILNTPKNDSIIAKIRSTIIGG